MKPWARVSTRIRHGRNIVCARRVDSTELQDESREDEERSAQLRAPERGKKLRATGAVHAQQLRQLLFAAALDATRFPRLQRDTTPRLDSRYTKLVRFSRLFCPFGDLISLTVSQLIGIC